MFLHPQKLPHQPANLLVIVDNENLCHDLILQPTLYQTLLGLAMGLPPTEAASRQQQRVNLRKTPSSLRQRSDCFADGSIGLSAG
jgi:hypothetical protein